MGEAIARSLPGKVLDLTGRLSLPEMVEWLRAASLMVTNDTGPMHVGAALGIPLVGLFGPTEPFRTGPYGQVQNTLRLDLPCVPCMGSSCKIARPMKCLTALPVEVVIRRACELLPSFRT